MSDFITKMYQIHFGWGFAPNPDGELTALAKLLSRISKNERKDGKGRKGMRGRQKREGNGEVKGKGEAQNLWKSTLMVSMIAKGLKNPTQATYSLALMV